MFPILDKIFPLVVNNDYQGRVSVQGVKSLDDHFACLCQGFDFCKVKKILFFKKKREILLHFLSFYSEKSSKRKI